jgi:hypothetical protein
MQRWFRHEDLGDGVLGVLLSVCDMGAFRMSTRQCPNCGSENLALMRTLDLKYCCCGQWLRWTLDDGQVPVGYTKPVVESGNEKGLHKLEVLNNEGKDNGH